MNSSTHKQIRINIRKPKHTSTYKNTDPHKQYNPIPMSCVRVYTSTPSSTLPDTIGND